MRLQSNTFILNDWPLLDSASNLLNGDEWVASCLTAFGAALSARERPKLGGRWTDGF
jgi:hypothetical protein